MYGPVSVIGHNSDQSSEEKDMPTTNTKAETKEKANTPSTQPAIAQRKEAPSAQAAPQKPAKRPRKVTLRTIQRMKRQGEKIAMLTAYDAPFAHLLDRSGIDMILVGDSLGMVLQGEENTLAVTLDHMVYHTSCVARVTKRAMIVGDLPFMSYQLSPEQALMSAGRLVQEGKAHAVKLEGGRDMVPTVQKITRAGIPVVGHLGLTPQSVNAFGGFVVQGRSPERAAELKEDALLLQEAGAFCIVLEGIPSQLAVEITALLDIPTIGIGAGEGCDGQVLVTYDMLGLTPGFVPSFVKQYAQLHSLMEKAVEGYVQEVKDVSFPTEDYSYK